MLLALLSLGCPRPEPVAQVAPVPVAAAVGIAADSPEGRAHGLFASRDAVDCAAVAGALGDDARTAVTYVADATTMPPYAPMRAAHCLVERWPADAQALFVGWMGAPAKKGLALQTLHEADQLDEPSALALGVAALAGPHAEPAQKILAQSKHPAVRALVNP